MDLLAAADGEEFLHAVGSEGLLHRLDQPHRELGVSVGEEGIRGAGDKLGERP